MQIKGPGGGGPIKGPDQPSQPDKAKLEPQGHETPGIVPDVLEKGTRTNLGDVLKGASHVNSGPTGHSNGAGHADFTKNPDFQQFEHGIKNLLQGTRQATQGQRTFASMPAFTHFADKVTSLLDKVASHVNSGPTGHSNGAGHADFTKSGRPGEVSLPAGQLAVSGLPSAIGDRVGLPGHGASHTNAGPSGHSNGAGHANFSKDPTFERFVFEARTLLDKAASHVNSGPTGHSNGAGHADFTKDFGFEKFVNEFNNLIQQAGIDLGRAASHVNSGPTGHSNGAGHADFTKQGNPGDIVGNPGGNFGNPGIG